MLTSAEYLTAAASVPCDVPAIKTVEAVESNGNGFLGDGRPKILFEAHIFGSLTGHQWDADHPTISAPNWEVGKQYYVGGYGEYGRLNQAMALNATAARESASWGAYQVMGFNWRSLGYVSVEKFVEAMSTDMGQLEAMLRFVKVNNLGRYMRDFANLQSCKAFAAGYNGTGAIAVYGQKIFEAYQHFNSGGAGGPHARTLSIGMKGDDVKALQAELNEVIDPIVMVDGDFGPATLRAVMDFQSRVGLVRDGVVGHATRAALGLPE